MNSRVFTSTWLLLAALVLGWLPPALAADWARLSPFTAVRCDAQSAIVRFQDREWDLVSINDLTVSALLDVCRREFGNSWQRRFIEDLVEVLHRAGRPMAGDQTVKLVLKERPAGQLATIERAPMTRENRTAVHRAFEAASGNAPLADDLPAALDRFEKALHEQWAYFRANDVDFGAAVRALRAKFQAAPMDPSTFALELQKIIALGIDGHARVDGYTLPGGFLPFLIEPAGARLVAFSADRSGFLDPAHPYIVKLDGKPLQDWLNAAAILVVKGSPQYVRRHSLRTLRNVEYVRQQLGLPAGEELRVELQSADARGTKELRIKIAPRLPVYGEWPAGGSRSLPGDFGYLRLTAMDEKAVEEIRAWMPRFREAKGLVVDVRGNGGGSRDALLQLYSYLTAPAHSPKVVNAAAYRLAPAFKPDHLQSRFLFPEAASTWQPAERESIAAFKKSFHPQRPLPPGQFSEWHYLVLNRLPDPAIFHYDRPVTVLLDEKCFSATDIFLAGLKGLPKVRLVGTPSGGGSARAMTVQLTSTASVRLGSMVSFQSDGTLFDGRGVQPDLPVDPSPDYFIGKADPVLDRALEFLRTGK